MLLQGRCQEIDPRIYASNRRAAFVPLARDESRGALMKLAVAAIKSV